MEMFFYIIHVCAIQNYFTNVIQMKTLKCLSFRAKIIRRETFFTERDMADLEEECSKNY